MMVVYAKGVDLDYEITSFLMAIDESASEAGLCHWTKPSYWSCDSSSHDNRAEDGSSAGNATAV